MEKDKDRHINRHTDRQRETDRREGDRMDERERLTDTDREQT